METKEGVPVKYAPVDLAPPPALPAVVREQETENKRQSWFRGLFWLFYGLIGLSVAILISHVFPVYLHCFKETCPVPMVLMDVVMLVTTVVIWPVVIIGLVIGQTIAMFL